MSLPPPNYLDRSVQMEWGTGQPSGSRSMTASTKVMNRPSTRMPSGPRGRPGSRGAGACARDGLARASVPRPRVRSGGADARVDARWVRRFPRCDLGLLREQVAQLVGAGEEHALRERVDVEIDGCTVRQ